MRVHRIGLRAFCAASVACLTLSAAAQVTKDGYTFIDVKSPSDPTFTQLLGINDRQEIAGYFGCGTLPNHPNKGFTLVFTNSSNGPFGGTPVFTSENFPGSVQDQNFGVNNLANPSTVGFWQDTNGVDHGYINVNGTFTTIDAPGTAMFGNQILGLDDNNDVAGFNTNSGGTTFAEVEYNAPGNTINTLQLGSPPLSPGITLPIGSTMATGINPGFDGTPSFPGQVNLISGFNMNTRNMVTTSNAFVIGTPSPGGRRGSVALANNIMALGGSTFIQALGVNRNGLVVGTYTDVNGVMHGFTFSLQSGIFQTVDDPNANQQAGFGTTINGVNSLGQIVGFYTNGAMTNPPCQDTVGFAAYPATNLPPAPLYAALLPGSRTVAAGTAATIFASIINSGTTGLSGCAPALAAGAPTTLSLTYAPTNPVTNQINGPANTPVTIPAGATQSFVLGFSSTAVSNLSALPITFACSSVQPAPVFPGLTTLNLLFTSTSAPEPDMIALAATNPNTPGVCVADYTDNVPCAFAVATINNNVTGQVTVTPVTGSVGLPLSSLQVCQTNPSNAQCLATPANSLTLTVNAQATPTFSVFVTANDAIGFAPGAARVGLNFTDPNTGALLGSTDVAIKAQ